MGLWFARKEEEEEEEGGDSLITHDEGCRRERLLSAALWQCEADDRDRHLQMVARVGVKHIDIITLHPSDWGLITFNGGLLLTEGVFSLISLSFSKSSLPSHNYDLGVEVDVIYNS